MTRAQTKVIIIGGGLAGSYLASLLQENCAVTLLTKGALTDSNSALAQGGIAAAVAADDSIEAHFADSLAAGAQYNDAHNLKCLVSEGKAVVEALIADGMDFDKNADGSLDFGLEGAHSTPRILHAGGDSTGQKVLQFVQAKFKNVQILENAFVTELLVRDAENHAEVYGVRFLNADGDEMIQLADVVILATGGLGKLYKFNTNCAVISADGMALAKRSGAKLRDMEFVQFHPTLLKGDDPILISEAVRGAGAKLVNSSGEYFMENLHKYADLAPRDIVSREIMQQILQGEEVFLDTKSCRNFEEKFPFITKKLRENGVNMELIPIIPAAHFFMGGVETDEFGRTNLQNLYAVGEVASTRVHGANRLASNSLLECLVFAKKAAQNIQTLHFDSRQEIEALRAKPRCEVNVPELAELQERAWNNIGIKRNRRDLAEFLRWLTKFDTRIIVPDRDIMERENMVLTAREIAAAALKRTESLGAHYIEEEYE
jgi:L-aspartate oxidase